jgi:putative ABC transport system substrate-binding protein
MKQYRNLFAGALALAMTLALSACGGTVASSSAASGSMSGSASGSAAASASAPAGGNVPVIGICQYGEHPSLDNCRKGFLEGLTEAGLTEGKDYKIDYQNAGFDDSIDTQIAKSFSAEDCALMCAIATPSAVKCYAAAEDKNIPVIFTAVTDPEAAGLTEGNCTGTSDKLPVEAQLELIREMQPDADTIGIVYTTSEPNSVSAIAEYEAKAGDYGFTIDSVGVTAQSEVTQGVDKLISDGVDCFSNLTDNNVVGVLASVLEKTNEAGIPVYGSEVEQVKSGCVASAGIDYYKLGIQTGAMAAKVLTGASTCDDLPFETISEYGIYVNSEAISALNLTLPDSVAQKAVEASKA